MAQVHDKINSLISDYMKLMKEAIGRKISESGNILEVQNFVQEYPILVLKEGDYSKRKRVKTNVPLYEKCLAKCANGDQCSRRKNKDVDYCGTHIKGCPHGVVSNSDANGKNSPNVNNETGSYGAAMANGTGEGTGQGSGMIKKQIHVWLEDINGIMYWINDDGSVYDTGDIMNSLENPRIIAKYEKKIEGDNEVYKIIGEVH
jgi:hypothetical protein